uniref:DUF3347 domain-containing protein n=1 Tax=Salegentibacter sp. TaxID=1903072 RepID=UPI003565BEE1
LGDAYVVEEGLQEGDEIVVNGTFTVDAAVQLAGKPSMMNPSGDATSTGHDHGNSSSTAEEERTPDETFEISEEAKADLGKFLTTYLELKDALVADDFDAAENQLALLESRFKEIEDSNFDEKAADAWEGYKTQLERDLSSIASAKNIEALRESFDEFSSVIIRIAAVFDPLDEKLYVQHCPMADNDQGADWLSLSEEIRNPYYGEAMLTCGEVTGIVE